MHSKKIKTFFEEVEQAGNSLDLALTDSQYEDQFIFANPDGSQVVEKQKFLAALPKRHEFFKSLGHQSTRILSVDETRLDEQYTMVKAQFLMQFRRPSGQLVETEVDSIYILFLKGDSPKIVMQIEHEDLQEAMKARGLL